MKFKFFNVCWIIAVFLCGPAVQAAGCRRVNFVAHHQPAAVIVNKVVDYVAPVVVKTIFREIPIYNTQFYGVAPYAPAAYPASAPPPAYPAAAAVSCEQKFAETFRQFGELLKQVDSRLQALEGGVQPGVAPRQPFKIPPMPGADNGNGQPPQAPPPQQPQSVPGEDELLTLLVKHCSACHDSSKSATAGGKFTMLEQGKFSASLTPDSLGDIFDRLSTKDPNRIMPKPPHDMPDVERLRMIQLMVRGPAGQQPADKSKQPAPQPK